MVKRQENSRSKVFRRAPVTIEFVGHAGSGKTFLRERLVAALDGQHTVSWQIKVSVRDLILFSLFHPRAILDTVNLVRRTHPGTVSSGAKAVAKLLFYQIKRKKADRLGCEFVVFDEGLLHRLRMLRSHSAAGSVSYAELDPSVRKRLFPAPDLVVFVVASLETTAQRKVTRDAISGGESIDEMIRRKRANFGRLIQRTENDIRAARREQGFHYLRIQNEADSSVAENIRHILDELAVLESGKSTLRAR